MIEDKVGLKKLIVSRPNWSETRLNKEFCKKIKIIKKSRLSKDFLIGARIESFILGKGLKDGLKRAEVYSKSELIWY